MDKQIKVVACEKPSVPSHGLEIFTCVGRGRLGSAIRVYNLKKILTPFIYNQFFCYFPISQKADSFCKRADMAYKFYYHCHCNSPGSLQCLAAKSVLLSCFNHMPVTLFSERNVKTVPVCCNTWICCPLMFLGASQMHKTHFYFLFSGVMEDDFSSKWYSYQTVKRITFSETCELISIKCKCSDTLQQCISRFEKRFNFLRMLYCCSLIYRGLSEPSLDVA
ncbi:E4.2 [Ovine adenovirus 7]|uniref:E4.2 n=1 Tax=Ovine adenovirus D serotype 7 (isolate OAV287) TaxID=114430 RepID=P89027_ADEO7|nr:E4.2 [Ovine adenovirus 7]AAD45954.1 E4.2 [Ovine adenovirus 7]